MSQSPSNIIIGPAFPLKGGIANFNEALASAFQVAGIESTIVSFSLQYPSLLFPGKTQLAKGDAPPSGISIFPMISSINPFSWFKTARFIAQRKPDFVVIRFWIPFMGPALGTIARLIKKKLPGVPIIAITDNVIPHEKRPFDKPFTSWFINSCDGFVVMSQSVGNDLRQFDTLKPVIMQPHPVYNIFGEPVSREEACSTLQLDPHLKYILFFGLIRKYKGLDLLLEAFAASSAKDPDLRLLVAGEFYEDEEAYRKQIKALGIETRVMIHNRYIPKEEVRHFFGAASLVVQPYRDATQSGVTQIAYHFLKPMIVTDVGGLPEMVPHGKAGFVTPVSAMAIAEAIDEFFEKNYEKEFTEGVRKMAGNYSWEAFTNGVNELVARLKKPSK